MSHIIDGSRLPLVDSQNNLVGIVSQWDIVNFLNEHKGRHELVRQVGFTLVRVDCSQTSHSIIDALSSSFLS
jgi:Mg/Co/Ni transporter MgtE